MRQFAEFVAVLACGLFTGAAVYVSLVEHPARMECGGEIATAEFAPSYRRGTIMQVTLAAVCLLSSIAAWLAGATFWWVVAGVLQVSVIPFTLIVILPTNKQLLNPALDRRSVQTGRLLARWGRLHALRSVLSGVALLLFLYLANRQEAPFSRTPKRKQVYCDFGVECFGARYAGKKFSLPGDFKSLDPIFVFPAGRVLLPPE